MSTLTVDTIIGANRTTQAAERILTQGAGPNMNTWIVGNVPVGHYTQAFEQPVRDAGQKAYELGEKTFFVKGRMMAGQADLKSNSMGLTEFRWLAKEEIQKLVTPRYWSMTQDMLTER